VKVLVGTRCGRCECWAGCAGAAQRNFLERLGNDRLFSTSRWVSINLLCFNLLWTHLSVRLFSDAALFTQESNMSLYISSFTPNTSTRKLLAPRPPRTIALYPDGSPTMIRGIASSRKWPMPTKQDNDVCAGLDRAQRASTVTAHQKAKLRQWVWKEAVQ